MKPVGNFLLVYPISTSPLYHDRRDKRDEQGQPATRRVLKPAGSAIILTAGIVGQRADKNQFEIELATGWPWWRRRLAAGKCWFGKSNRKANRKPPREILICRRGKPGAWTFINTFFVVLLISLKSFSFLFFLSLSFSYFFQKRDDEKIKKFKKGKRKNKKIKKIK